MLEYRGCVVTFTETIGGYLGEVYVDKWMCYPIDDFIVPRKENMEEYAKKHIDTHIQSYPKR